MSHLLRARNFLGTVGGMALLAGWAAAGCRNVSPEQSGLSTTASATTTATTSLSAPLSFPAGYGLGRVTLAAADGVVLGPSDHIEGTASTPGTVTSAGSGKTTLGPGATVGDIVSVGGVSLFPKATAVNIRTGATATLAPGATAGTIVNQAVLTPLATRTIVAGPFNDTTLDANIAANATKTLAPGRYRCINIDPGATVTLSSGDYIADRIILSSKARLVLKTQAGSVNLYIRDSVIWHGGMTGDGSRFLLALMSTATLSLEGPFQGTALAPLGTLTIGPASTYPDLFANKAIAFQGTFYGKKIVVGPNVRISKLGSPLLVDSLSVATTTPCIGQPTEVKVDASGAGPGAEVWIQGVMGDHQFVQFRDAPGPRSVWAAVYTSDGRADYATIPVTVSQCAPKAGESAPFTFHFWGALGKTNAVELSVRGYDGNGHEVAPPAGASYAWTFGDGQTLVTTSPLVTHDYSENVDALAPTNTFDVSVTATSAGKTFTVRKAIPLWNLYAQNRAKGIVQPTVSLALGSNSVVATIKNREPTAISLTRATIELLPCDADLPPQPQPPQTLLTSVAAGATGTVSLSASATGSDICALGVHVGGSTAAGAVYADGYLVVRENSALAQTVTDPGLAAALDRAATLTADPNHFDDAELRTLVSGGALPPLPAPPAAAPTALHALSLAKALGPQPGQTCQPGDKDTSPLGLVCQPAPGWVYVGGEIVNAFKGNFIMSHGCGPIGKLLSAVHQRYSHTMTMVRNHVSLRHSTASSERMMSKDNVDLVGRTIKPSILQFGFPGTDGLRAYSVDEMTDRYFVSDPEDSSKTWEMAGELTPAPQKCDSDMTALPTLVVRAAPDAPANVLANVASVGDHADVNGHYRFFHYSHAEQAVTASGWAAGTQPTVCSSFDRLSAVGAGVPLHPTLNLPGVPDGLRAYTVDERMAAAYTLNKTMRNSVAESCNPDTLTPSSFLGGAAYLLGGPLSFMADAAVHAFCSSMIENIGNQIVNCFANDRCGDTSATWQHPGSGIAVSPDDIFSWDSWKDGGTYGFSEPVVYKPRAYRHAYAWAAAPGAGNLTVKVVHPDQSAYPEATVLINGDAVGSTDGAGTFQLPQIASGNYLVGAQFDPCAMAAGSGAPCMLPLEQASQAAVLAQNGSLTVTLVLCAGTIVNGVPTSCSQPGTGPRFTHVGIEPDNDVYLVCLYGDGVAPGTPLQINLINVPLGYPGPYSAPVDSAGKFSTSLTLDRQFCGGGGDVTIRAYDPVNDVTIDTTAPAKYWCSPKSQLFLPPFGGGCNF